MELYSFTYTFFSIVIPIRIYYFLEAHVSPNKIFEYKNCIL